MEIKFHNNSVSFIISWVISLSSTRNSCEVSSTYLSNLRQQQVYDYCKCWEILFEISEDIRCISAIMLGTIDFKRISGPTTLITTGHK
jgi:hypothetical protein